jgi:type VI secretion system secreted protein VgrG
VPVHGRALARNAAVTLDTDTFTAPTCQSAGQPTGTDTSLGSGQPTGTAQPGTPTNSQLGVPPTSLAFTGTRIVLPLVLGVMFIAFGAATIHLERVRKLAKI